MVNFSINMDSLQTQMLALVVKNERRDLEDGFALNQREAFDSIDALKKLEATILA